MAKKYNQVKFNNTTFALPQNYPSLEAKENYVFYIQRNLDQNTVVYSLNTNVHGDINMHKPLRIYWKRFEEQGQIQELNVLQTNLAYGYDAQIINSDAFSFQFKAYNKLNLFLVREDDGFKVVCKIQGKDAILNKIYVDLDFSGIFPLGRFYELYGKDKETEKFIYEKTYF